MATGTVVTHTPVKSQTVETSPDGQQKINYISADGVFSDVPVATLDAITYLAKRKFASEIVAATGTITDAKLSAYRLAWLMDTVESLHKSAKKADADSAERKARKFYQELRERGFSKEDAAKTARYNPLD